MKQQRQGFVAEAARRGSRRIGPMLAWPFGSVAVAGAVVAPFLIVRASPRFDVVDVLSSTGFILVFALFGALGILLAARRPENPIGPMFACAGAFMSVGVLLGVYAEAGLPGKIWAGWLTEWLPFLAIPFVPLILLVFPDGELLSRRWSPVFWIAVLSAPWLALGTAITPGDMGDSGLVNPVGVDQVPGGELLEEGGIGWLFLMVAFLGSALSLVVRFRRSRGVQRQQMKGLALAAALLGAGWLVVSSFWTVLGDAVYLFMIPAFAALPVATSLAILKYRLYDIDIVINRTLVYALLTGVLVGAYALGVLIFRTLLDPVTRDNDFAIAASTLAVAALFGPARRKIQGFIDRRFYRARYDAQQTLESFAERLREEVDLDALATELVVVVSKTMHPQHAGIWVRSAEAAGSTGARE